MSMIDGRLGALRARAWLCTCAALALLAVACDDTLEPIALHSAVTAKRIDDPRGSQGHWRDNGFVEMVPPVRLPSDKSARDRIAVWLKVGTGEGQKINARRLADGRVTLVFPPGTVADRVESMGDAVIDVRGTTLDDGGVERFHVYVAEEEAPSALVGWEWRRGDFDAEASATRALLAQLHKTRRRMKGEPPPSEQQHRNSIMIYERNNNCGACHAHDKPPTTRGNAVHRATDASGFFVPLSVLAAELPLERHRPWEMNVGDPFLTLRCESGAPRLVERGFARSYVCAGAEVPTARLDVPRALAADDERARAMCASRRYLHEHMSDDARALFADAFVACGITP
jgi:hypothetical protein